MLETIHNFLEIPRIAYFSSIDLQGYPHTVPAWFGMDGDDLIFSSAKARTRVKFVQANPKGAVTIGGNLDEAEGYMIQGEITIEEDPNHALAAQIASHYISGEALAQFLAGVETEERIIFRLAPVKVIRVQ